MISSPDLVEDSSAVQPSNHASAGEPDDGQQLQPDLGLGHLEAEADGNVGTRPDVARWTVSFEMKLVKNIDILFNRQPFMEF